jgi:small conductance mechanosensitive channel
MEDDMDAVKLSAQATTLLSELANWAATTGPNLMIAILILVGGWWLAGRAQRSVFRLIEDQPNIDSTLRIFISSLVRYTIIVVVLVAVLGQIGVQTTSILAALGAAAIAIGLAMQGTLSNIAAGIMLVWLRPFRVGDYIESGSTAGTVQDIGLFASELHTLDGIYLFVPNSELWSTRITNYTRLPTRMIDLKFGVAYSDDIAKGLRVLLELGKSDERAHSEPEAQVFVDELGDSAVVLSLRVWVATAEYWQVRRDLTGRGKAALEAAGLTIPFPQRDVHLYPTSAVPQGRVA